MIGRRDHSISSARATPGGLARFTGQGGHGGPPYGPGLAAGLAGLLLCALLLPAAAWGAPPKATAPVDLRAEALDPVKAGVPLRLRLTAVPLVDAPLLKLVWLLPPGVLLEAGSSDSWSGLAAASAPKTLTVTVRLADLEPRTIIAGAIIERPGGARQVKAASLELPPGAAAKAPRQPAFARNAQGESVVDHVMEPAPAAGR